MAIVEAAVVLGEAMLWVALAERVDALRETRW